MAVNKSGNAFLDPSNYKVRLLRDVECYVHLHFQTEIALVVKGKLTIHGEISDAVLTAGMAMLILPYEIHGYKSEQGTETIIIEFNRLMFDEFANCAKFSGKSFVISDSTMAYINALIGEQTRSTVYLKAMIYPLLNEMLDSGEIDAEALPSGELYRRVLDYIDEFFAEKISLKTAAENAGCSYVYLSRLFSKSAGMTFTTYLNRYRIIRSLHKLKNSDMNITEIAFMSGFETLRSYNREFKKIFNMTPGQYRDCGYESHIKEL